MDARRGTDKAGDLDGRLVSTTGIIGDGYKTAEKLLDEGCRESNHHFRHQVQMAVQTIGIFAANKGGI